MENKEEEKKKWGLYVLRYNYSGNYYVGSAPDLKDRMLIHWRRTSKENDLPIWSVLNISTEGFKCYWFNIDCNDASQSVANCSENAFIDEIVNEIKKLSDNELERKIDIYGGYKVNFPYPKEVKPVEKDSLENDERHKKIDMYLKKISEHKLETKKGEYSISLLEIGTVGEYQDKDCNKDWYELATIEFSVDNKGK